MTTQNIIDFDGSEFFAPAPSDFFDHVIAQYNRERETIKEAVNFIGGLQSSTTLNYFLEGNLDRSRGGTSTAEKLFKEEGAVKALNSSYWQKILAMTDVIEYMPAKRRTDWYDQIRNFDTPDFKAETVRSTILDLLSMRSTFLAEKVDGVFRALSGSHVTNRPQAFGKRMIFRVSNNDIINYEMIRHLQDLRSVIAKFMGRDAPLNGLTDKIIKVAEKTIGKWVSVDGGAFKIRVYKVGTAHIEVHEDMAWRLNAILAHLYPGAIPVSLRRKPTKTKKPIQCKEIERPLPFAVLDVLSEMSEDTVSVCEIRNTYNRVPNTLRFRYGAFKDKHVAEEAASVLELIGGVKDSTRAVYRFDYDPTSAINTIIVSGMIPDQKTHQYYPTSEKLARLAVEAAEIKPGDVCLEPSAGLGGIALLMPKEKTVCVEISSLFAEVLRGKGLNVEQSDFLEWSAQTIKRFDKVVMNPPYSQSRWQAHLDAAASLVLPGGALVAILPASAKDQALLPGWDLSWSQVYKNEFKNTGVSVVMLTAVKV